MVATVLVLFLFVANVIVWPGERAYACSCAESSAKDKLKRYSAVFTGKVVEIEGDSIVYCEICPTKHPLMDVSSLREGMLIF